MAASRSSRGSAQRRPRSGWRSLGNTRPKRHSRLPPADRLPRSSALMGIAGENERPEQLVFGIRREGGGDPEPRHVVIEHVGAVRR
jgi:hypothetical protein